MRSLASRMSLIRKAFVGAVFALSCLPQMVAQQQQFRQYGAVEGLNNLNVRCLMQGVKGYIWVGTDNGLFRFDGRDFREYSHMDGLPSTEIQSVAQSPLDLTIWVATPSGLARLKDGRLETSGLSGSSIPTGMHQIVFDRQGVMFLLNSTGILRGIPTNEGGYHFQPLVQGDVHGLMVDGDVLYFSRDGDLLRMEHGKTESIGVHFGLPQDDWAAMIRDSHHSLWVRSTTRLYQLPAGTRHFVDRSAGIPHAIDPRLSADSTGHVYVGSLAGAAILDGEKIDFLDVKHGLPAETVSPILIDRNDSLWLGMSGAGLVRRLGHGEWVSWKRENGLIHNSVWAIHHDTSGKIWAGTSGGLTLFHADGTVMRSWSTESGLPADRVLSLAQANSGDIFAGTDPRGLTQFSAEGKLLRVYNEAQGIEHRVTAMALDHEGRLWTIGGDGVLRSESLTHAGAMAHFMHVGAPTLPDDTAFRDISITADGIVWISTSHGLLRYSPDGWRCFTRKDGLLSDDLANVVERDGVVWISYRDSLGLMRFTVDGDRLGGHSVSSKDGLASDEIYGLLFDGQGRLWANNDKGVDVLTNGTWQHFGSEDGLVWNDTNGRALSVDGLGDVWIGTSGGMSRYSPPAHPLTPRAPVPAITEIHSAHREWEPDNHPNLPYAERTLSFQFASLGSTAERVNFRYRLQGAEDNWIETEQRSVRFAALPAGSYVFQVSTQDTNGTWSQPPASFSFTIQEPWWQTKSFLGGIALLTILVGRFFWRLRVKALVSQKERLQHVVDQQTAELREQHRQLENIAYLDQLTSLPNRRMFTRDIRGRIEAATIEGSTFALLLIDLDRFKHVNDTYGHDAGDAVLTTTSSRLRAALRTRDSIARLGGDEFAILLGEQIQPEVVERICERVVDSCSEAVYFQGQRLQIGCSIGIAVFPTDGRSEEELCKAADLALYSVKRTTRNHFSWFGLAPVFSSH